MASLLQPGSRIAGYEILEQVGKGGMGEVYRARQVSMDRIVALKILSPKLVAKDPAFTERFIAEARAAGRLNHPHIIGVHDVGGTVLVGADGVERPIHYFSMEFVQGETLKDVVERRGVLSPSEVAPIAMAMAEALVYAEAQRVVHRDIKPENIMVGEGGLVKLADLGLAEQVSDEVADDPDPKARKVMGTPMYMSPEQARGLTVGHASDQYSLGATLFHLLTGRAPYTAKDGKAMMRAHVLEPVPDPHDVVSDLAEGWRQLCLRLMAKEPGQRYPSAVDMRAAIIAAIAGAGAHSRRTRVPRGGTTAVGGARRPNTSPVIPGVVVVLVIAAAVGGWLVFGRGTGSDQSASEVGDPTPVTVVDDSLVAARNLVAGLGRDHAVAIAALDQALADGSLSPAAREVLSTERVRHDEAQQAARAAALAAHATSLDAIAELIAAGNLNMAHEQLAATAAEPMAERYAQLLTAHAQAVAAAAEKLATAIPQADADRLKVLQAEAATLPVADETRVRLDAAFAARNETLAAAARVAAARAQEEPRWTELALVLERHRFTSDYAAAHTALASAAAAFPTDELRERAAALQHVAELAQQAETWLRNHCRARSPVTDLRVGGVLRKVAIMGIEDTVVNVRPLSAPVTRLERIAVVLNWRDLIGQAMAALPSDVRKDALRYQFGFCVFWAPDVATAIAGEMGDDPLAKLYLELDRRRPPPRLGVPVQRTGDAVRMMYEFLPGEPRFPRDFLGDGLAGGEFGLRWRSSVAVPRGDFNEKVLPTVEWAARVTVPCTFTVRLRLNRETQVAMVGVDVGGKRVRTALNLTGIGGKIYAGTIFTDDNGHFSIGAQNPMDIDVTQAVEFQLTVDAQNRLTTRVGRDTIERNRELPSGPVGLVLQFYQAAAGGSLEIETIEIQGASLEPLGQR